MSRHLRLLVILALCNSLGALAMQILTPALPTIRASFQATLAQTQLVVTTFSAVLALSMLVYGPLADRFDRKRLLVFGMILFSLGSFVGYIATSLETLIFARALQAMGAAAASTITRAIAADVFQGDDLNRAMSAMLMIVVVGPMVAPVLGGYIVDNGSWQIILAMLFALGLLLTITTWFLLQLTPSYPQVTKTRGGYWSGVGDIFRNARFRSNMAVLVVIQIGVYAYISASPYLVIEHLGYSASQYGFVFVYLTVGYMAGNFVSGVFVKTIGGTQLVRWATIAYLAGAGWFAACAFAGIENLFSVVGPAVLLTFTNGITQPNCSAGALASVTGRKGVAASLSGFGQLMAGAIGFQWVGFLEISSTLSIAAILGFCGIVGALTAAVSKPGSH